MSLKSIEASLTEAVETADETAKAKIIGVVAQIEEVLLAHRILTAVAFIAGVALGYKIAVW